MGGIDQVLRQKHGIGLGANGGAGGVAGVSLEGGGDVGLAQGPGGAGLERECRPRNAPALYCRGDEGEVLQVLGTRTRILCDSESTERAFSLMEVEVPSGFGPPPHRHPWAEGYYVLRGIVGFTLDGRQLVAQAGDFLYAPADMAHSFCGQSEEPAQLLIFDLPAHSQAFFRAVDREVKAIPADLHKLPALGAQHRLEFL